MGEKVLEEENRDLAQNSEQAGTADLAVQALVDEEVLVEDNKGDLMHGR